MTYLYTGPMSGVTLATADGPREVLLIPGKPADLPGTHEYTRILLARGHLVPVAPAKAAAPKKTAKGA